MKGVLFMKNERYESPVIQVICVEPDESIMDGQGIGSMGSEIR